MGMNDDQNVGVGTPSRGATPSLSKQFSPASGGYGGEQFESAGMPGDKGEGGSSAPGGNTTEGDYCSKAHTVGGYPHGPEDPSMEGPPLGTIAGPNGATNQ